MSCGEPNQARRSTALPKISVITPSFNQGQFIEKNLGSVLAQGYPHVEHLVIDGGSTDNTVDILKRYEASLYYWVSERDGGQSAAINKGFHLATGDILCWLNSDDYFEEGALLFVGEYFAAHKEVDMICGGMRTVDADGNILRVQRSYYGGRHHLLQFWHGYAMHQPSIFWRRKVYDAIGGVDPSLHLSMDYDYWLRISERFQIENVDHILASAIEHAAQKTSDNFLGYKRAQLKDAIRHFGLPQRPSEFRLNVILYRYLLKTVFNLCCGRGTFYSDGTKSLIDSEVEKR